MQAVHSPSTCIHHSSAPVRSIRMPCTCFCSCCPLRVNATNADFVPVAYFKGFAHVKKRDELSLMWAVWKHGPVAISLDASQPSFKFYSEGVYSDKHCLVKKVGGGRHLCSWHATKVDRSCRCVLLVPLSPRLFHICHCCSHSTGKQHGLTRLLVTWHSGVAGCVALWHGRSCSDLVSNMVSPGCRPFGMLTECRGIA